MCDLRRTPELAEAATAAERRWGVPVGVQMAIIWRESSFRAAARPPKRYVLGVPSGHISTAYGYSQALDGTWDWYQRDTGNRSADRTNFADATDFVGWYMTKSLDTNGIPLNDAYNQYLAYHEGHTGYRRRSYLAKDWLIGVAGQVADQAVMYSVQLPTCS